MWYVQLLLSYAGNSTTGDYKCDFSFPSASGWYDYVGDNTTADAINVSTGIQFATLTNFAAAVGLGTDAASTPRMFCLEMMIRRDRGGHGPVPLREQHRGSRRQLDHQGRLDPESQEARVGHERCGA